MKPPHLLTFPCSPSVLHQLGQLECTWDVITRGRAALTQPWLTARDAPAGARVLRWSDAVGELRRGTFAAVVCHRLHDLVELRAVSPSVPAVLRANPRLEAMFGLGADEVLSIVDPSGTPTVCVFDSDAHRAEWPDRVPGDVIAPGLDVDEFGPFTGEAISVLVIGHLQLELPQLSGFGMLERLAAGLPLDLLGFNPALGRDQLLVSHAARREAYRRHRLYLNTVGAPFGDAANLEVLEAMASGAPVVSVFDPASPVEHGVTGFVGDTESLRSHMLELLEDGKLAERLGRAARERIARDYSVGRFQSGWHSLLRRLQGVHERLTPISA